MAKTKHTPTTEQQAIIDHAEQNPRKGRKCIAFAGSGKTSTLEMLADDNRAPGLYLAFNRAIKEEASKRFPRHIKVVTAHGAAYGALQMHHQQSRLNQKMYGDSVQGLVRLPRCRMHPDALGQVVLDSVSRFCNSADAEPDMSHVALDPKEPEDLRQSALIGTKALWEKMISRNSDCPITHDTYLKLWQLNKPTIRNVEWAMFDEAQDASPVMIDIMAKQRLPITFVGDPHQSIYQWRGAINAMREMPGAEFPLTQSFRFGQDVAQLANAVLANKPEWTRPKHNIVGNPNKQSVLGKLTPITKHTFISRTNAEWFSEALAYQGRVHVVGGLDETEKLLKGAYHLWRNNERPEKCPAVARFSSWRQLCEHAEQFDDRELMFARRVIEAYKETLPRAMQDLRRRHTDSEDDAHLILTTAHKSKGREWSYVRLGEGFVSPLDEGWEEMTDSAKEAELNLLYVALTRAIDGLQPNTAVIDCLKLATGARRSPLRLKTIEVANIQPVEPQPASLPPRPADGTATAPASTGRTFSVSAIAPWSPEQDAEIITMISNGFPIEDIAEWCDRSPLALALRLSVLGVEGYPRSLQTEALMALVPPVSMTQSQPENKKATGQPHPSGPRQAKVTFSPGFRQAAQSVQRIARNTDDWGMSAAERAAAMQSLRQKKT